MTARCGPRTERRDGVRPSAISRANIHSAGATRNEEIDQRPEPQRLGGRRGLDHQPLEHVAQRFQHQVHDEEIEPFRRALAADHERAEQAADDGGGVERALQCVHRLRFPRTRRIGLIQNVPAERFGRFRRAGVTLQVPRGGTHMQGAL